MKRINKIVVIGAGVMGSGIAEQFANADFKLHLLDITLKDAIDKNILAKQAIEKISKNLDKAFELIIPGNLEDDLEIIKSADLIIEAIVEKIELKLELYKKLELLCKSDVIITSNTSTICLKQLIEGRSDNFKQNFLITHFFNPPRYMQLVEVVTGDFTKKEVAQDICKFLDISLGKTPIKSNDTPGFIANRIGCYWLQVALNTAFKMNMAIEEADFLMSAPIGIPKTGVFGLYDLIGIDVMQLIVESLCENLNNQDDFKNYNEDLPLISKMIQNGFIGRKGKGGFYRITQDEQGNKIKEVIDLKTGEYREVNPIVWTFKNIKEVIDNSEYAKVTLCKTLNYALNLIDEVSDNLYDIDQAMKLGYNWKFGPFELVDQVGVDYFKKLLEQQNIKIPSILSSLQTKKFYQDNMYNDNKGIINLKSFNSKIYQNDSCVIKNIGDNIAVIELTSKMGILNHDVFYAILEFFAKYVQNFRGLVIANAQDNFSVGGNLKFMLEKANLNDFTDIKEYLKLGQQAMLKIKYSPIPVVASLRGMALGGGCEILLHAQGVTSYAEASVGLVESKVGLVPGWGGCKEIILKTDTKETRIEAFKNICSGNIFYSTDNFRKSFIFNNFKKVMNPNRVLSEAKQLALSLSDTHQVQPQKLAEKIDINWQKVIKDMSLTGYDKEIALNLAEIFLLTDLSENALLEKEQEIFISLLHNKETLEKIKQVL